MLINLPKLIINDVQDWACKNYMDNKIIYPINKTITLSYKDTDYQSISNKQDHTINVSLTFDTNCYVGGTINENSGDINLNFPKINNEDNNLICSRIRSSIAHEFTHLLQLKLSNDIKFGRANKYAHADYKLNYLQKEIEFYPQLRGHVNNFIYLASILPTDIFYLSFNYATNQLIDSIFFSQLISLCSKYQFNKEVDKLSTLAIAANNFVNQQGPDIDIMYNLLGPIVSARDFFNAIELQNSKKYRKAVKIFYIYLNKYF